MAEILKGLKCMDCGAGPFAKPVSICKECGSINLEEVDLSGNGKIFTFTNVHQGYGKMADKAPYCLAIVELAEGPKLITIVEDVDVEQVGIDEPVKIKYYNEENLPIFTKA
jgi:uncharacterized OB-fold protein